MTNEQMAAFLLQIVRQINQIHNDIETAVGRDPETMRVKDETTAVALMRLRGLSDSLRRSCHNLTDDEWYSVGW